LFDPLFDPFVLFRFVSCVYHGVCIRDEGWWEGYREIGKDGVLDWEENASRAFFPRSYTEVSACMLACLESIKNWFACSWLDDRDDDDDDGDDADDGGDNADDDNDRCTQCHTS
jgi:hypothetical protein